MAAPTDEDIFAYVQGAFPSVWALEVLRLLHRERARAWRATDLISELRGSEAAIGSAIAALEAAGLAVSEHDVVRFHAASDTVAELAQRTLEVYVVRPAWVIRAILTAPNAKLKIFANSFRLKD
ncbi:MAG TPA: hypothetical protein VL966_01290 [Alphaproteobacteria bacterium]|jgi:hypothetical protein|nr:hypothetical protein [Alphaproteobacteria bacterium]